MAVRYCYNMVCYRCLPLWLSSSRHDMTAGEVFFVLSSVAFIKSLFFVILVVTLIKTI